MNVRHIEGVPYFPFVIRYTIMCESPKRRKMVRWSPGYPWIYEEVGRELLARFGEHGIKPGSVTIRERPWRKPAEVTRKLNGLEVPEAFKLATVASAARETYRKKPNERELARLTRKIERLEK